MVAEIFLCICVVFSIKLHVQVYDQVTIIDRNRTTNCKNINFLDLFSTKFTSWIENICDYSWGTRHTIPYQLATLTLPCQIEIIKMWPCVATKFHEKNDKFFYWQNLSFIENEICLFTISIGGILVGVEYWYWVSTCEPTYLLGAVSIQISAQWSIAEIWHNNFDDP